MRQFPIFCAGLDQGASLSREVRTMCLSRESGLAIFAFLIGVLPALLVVVPQSKYRA
jgi:hypothetical protein